jgi:excisionase family DNA binding protein
METQTSRLAISVRDAADRLGISYRSVQKYVAAEVLPARKVGRRTLILVRDLELFLEQDQPSVPAYRRGGKRG